MQMGPWRLSMLLIIAVLFVVVTSGVVGKQEGLTDGVNEIGINTDCPNVIMQVNGAIHLYNTRKAKVPGVNPLVLPSLNSYPDLMDYLNAKGMNCPALFLRQGRSASGEIEMQQLVVSPQGQMVPLWGKAGFGSPSMLTNPSLTV